MRRDDPRVGVPEGFTFVEIIVGALIAGIFAAIIVFSVASVTHKAPVKVPDPVCIQEAGKVQDAITEYRLLNNNTNPPTLNALVKHKLLKVVPSATSPSGAAGYRYDPASGIYAAGSCPLIVKP